MAAALSRSGTAVDALRDDVQDALATRERVAVPEPNRPVLVPPGDPVAGQLLARRRERPVRVADEAVVDWVAVDLPGHRERRVTRQVDAGFVLTDLSEPRPQSDFEPHQYFEEETPRFVVFRARLD